MSENRYSATAVCRLCLFVSKGTGQSVRDAVFIARVILQGHFQGRPHFMSLDDARIEAALTDPTTVSLEKD